jgi:adenosylcobinamide amidohydrolase
MNAPALDTPRTRLRVEARPGWLLVRFARPQTFLSWAIVGGGRHQGDTVAWCQVRDDELPPGLDPRRLLSRRLRALGLRRPVGMLTSRSVDRFEDVTRAAGRDVQARCVATVGLGNALRIGDPTGADAGTGAASRRVGTINLMVSLSRPLAPAAQLEALSLAAEARTTAILDAGVASVRSGAPATGTGTDCIVVAAPLERQGAAYAGKHTALGEVVGAAVHAAVHAGARRWLEERACRA